MSRIAFVCQGGEEVIILKTRVAVDVNDIILITVQRWNQIEGGA